MRFISFAFTLGASSETVVKYNYEEPQICIERYVKFLSIWSLIYRIKVLFL